MSDTDAEDANLRGVEIGGDVAAAYEDIAGVVFDLKFAGYAARLLLARWPEDEPEVGFLDEEETTYSRALWNAALVAYGSCFSGGVRHSVDRTALVGTDADALAAHERFITLRDKHIAHSVNELERHLPVAVLDESGAEPRVVGVHPQTMLMVTETRNNIEAFVALTDIAMANAEQMEADATARLLADVESRPIADLASRPTVAFEMADPSRLSKPRRRRKE